MANPSLFPSRVNMLATLRRLDVLTITRVFGPLCRLNQNEIGRQWGEGYWTAKDLT